MIFHGSRYLRETRRPSIHGSMRCFTSKHPLNIGLVLLLELEDFFVGGIWRSPNLVS